VNKKSYLVGFRGWQTAVTEIEELYMKELMALEDAQEGLSAFMEKRDPVWQNK
jgi:1,4-dihydroxy-2-naphthoyl-CoA synthase